MATHVLWVSQTTWSLCAIDTAVNHHKSTTYSTTPDCHATAPSWRRASDGTTGAVLLAVVTLSPADTHHVALHASAGYAD